MSDEKYRLRCLIVTPESKVVDLPINEITLPLLDGRVGILPGHAPMLCQLKSDIVKYKDIDWGEYQIFVDGGFAHVRDTEVVILTPMVLRSGQVEALSARQALEEAFAMSNIGPGQAQKRQGAIERARQIMAFVDAQHG